MSAQNTSSKKVRRSQTVHKSLPSYGPCRKGRESSNDEVLDKVMDKNGRNERESINKGGMKSWVNPTSNTGNVESHSQKRMNRPSLPLSYTSYYNGRIAAGGSAAMDIGKMYNKGPVPLVIPKHRTSNSSLASQAA